MRPVWSYDASSAKLCGQACKQERGWLQTKPQLGHIHIDNLVNVQRYMLSLMLDKA